MSDKFDYINDVFGQNGMLAHRFHGYQPREGQIAFARAVDAAISRNGHLLAECPTGTGKSVAYAVPAIYHALQRRDPAAAAIIVTANIALQEQLVRKDLPLLAEILPWEFDYALLKGKNNFLCLSGDTKVVTKNGVFAIRELVDKVVELLDGNGDWVVSPVKAYGRDRLIKIILKRGNATMVIRATADHRWFVRESKNSDARLFESTTKKLRVGDRLGCIYRRPIARLLRPSGFGIAHGIVYGDGSLFGKTTGGSQTAHVMLHGQKNRELLRFFPGCHHYETNLQEYGYAENGVRVVDLPLFFKKKPSLEEAPSYLYGWLAGYFAADGCVSKVGEAVMSAASMEDIRFIQAVCTRLGIATGLPRAAMRVGINSTIATAIYSIAIVNATLSPDFFLLKQHRNRFDNKPRIRPKRLFWTVTAIEEDQEEDVFCATVPTTASFVLEGNLLTGNCIDRLINGAPGVAEQVDLEVIQKIMEWAEHTETGDVSELPFEPPYSAWSRFSVGSDDCVGSECDYYKSCFSELARKHAQRAHVVVTNYHLFFADMKIRQVTGGMVSVLPPYSIAVLDEGHKATDIARDFFGFRVTEGSLGWAGSMLPWQERAELESAGQALFMSLRSHKNSGMYKARLRKQNTVDTSLITEALKKARIAYGEMLDSMLGEDTTSEQRKEAIKIARKLGRIVEIEKQIELAMRLRSLPKMPWQPIPSLPDDPSGVQWYWSDPTNGGSGAVKTEADASSVDDVFYIEEDRGKVVLCSKPIRVDARLREELFKTTRSVSVTSATLMARGSFDFIAGDLGVDKPMTLEAKSPFNWREAALLVTPQDVPEPNAAEFTRAVAEKCRETVEFAKGRTLALFTSYKNLNAAHEAVLHTSYRVLRQGDMPRTQLIDEFRKDVNSVLLGVESFWAGVDVPGESLSCVFIDRLPFITPEDPVMDALSESDREWFMKYSVPRAIIAFKQGFGRLIRTVNDRGVVVLLDRRVSTKFYGKFFVNSLPPVQRSYNLEDVRRFLDREALVLTATAQPPETRSLFG